MITDTLLNADSFQFDTKKAANNLTSFGLRSSTVSGAAGIALYIFTEEPASAEASPEVQKVVSSALDTIPLLSGVCMAVFAAGLAPWAARTTLSWLSSIMKGAI
jgi:hypothetical protein